MQPRLWIAASVFLGSYFPLALILLVQDYDLKYLTHRICIPLVDSNQRCILPLMNPMFSLVFFSITLGCLLATVLALKSNPVKRRFTVKESKYIPSELINYSLPYVVSFMGVGYGEPSKFLGVMIFLLWMFWITYKSGLIILNPVLIALGWRLYEITFVKEGKKTEYKSTVLSKAALFSGTKYTYSLIQDVYIIKEEADAGQFDGT